MSLLSSLLSNPGKHIAFSHLVTLILSLLCDFPWELLDKHLFMIDRAQSTDQRNSSTLLHLSGPVTSLGLLTEVWVSVWLL